MEPYSPTSSMATVTLPLLTEAKDSSYAAINSGMPPDMDLKLTNCTLSSLIKYGYRFRGNTYKWAQT